MTPRLRLLVWATLAALYAAFLVRPVGGGQAGDRLEAMAPPARQVELAIGDGRFADALRLARALQEAYPRDPLVLYWLGTIYRGLDRFEDEARTWEAFAELSSEPRDACPAVVAAFERAGDASRARVWRQRCEGD